MTRPVGDEIHGGNRCVLVLAVQRHGQQLGLLTALAQPCQRAHPRRFGSAVPGDRTERVRVGQPRERSERDHLARRRAGNLGQCLDIDQRIDGRHAIRFGGALEGVERDVAQHHGRLLLHRLVLVVASDAAKHGGVEEFGHRGQPHLRALVFPGDRDNRVAFLEGDLLDVRETHGGIRMLVAGLCAKTIEQCHKFGISSASSRLATSRPCDAAST